MLKKPDIQESRGMIKSPEETALEAQLRAEMAGLAVQTVLLSDLQGGLLIDTIKLQLIRMNILLHNPSWMGYWIAMISSNSGTVTLQREQRTRYFWDASFTLAHRCSTLMT